MFTHRFGWWSEPAKGRRHRVNDDCAGRAQAVVEEVQEACLYGPAGTPARYVLWPCHKAEVDDRSRGLRPPLESIYKLALSSSIICCQIDIYTFIFEVVQRTKVPVEAGRKVAFHLKHSSKVS